MLRPLQILERLDISTTSTIRAIQQVRERVEDAPAPKAEAIKLIHDITGETIDVESSIDALHIAQSVVESAIVNKDNFSPEKALLVARKRVDDYRKNPALQYIYIAEKQTEQCETKEIGGVSVQINENGKIKKGGKALIAKQLFIEHVVQNKMEKREFIELLMKECAMSKAGATTYEHNVRKSYEKENQCVLPQEKRERRKKVNSQ